MKFNEMKFKPGHKKISNFDKELSQGSDYKVKLIFALFLIGFIGVVWMSLFSVDPNHRTHKQKSKRPVKMKKRSN